MECERFSSFCEKSLVDIESCLDTSLRTDLTEVTLLLEACRYATLVPCKRLRPLLVLASAATFNAKSDAAIRSAAAIELIHTYSLIHDDLPCMDNDDFRRGRLATHKAYGESTALLAGNALLTKAFELVLQDELIPPHSKLDILNIYAQASGIEGMMGGQYLDIHHEGKSITQEKLSQVHRLKSGCLIAASVEAGAIIGHALYTERETLKQFAYTLGVAFQIRDDLLDILSPEDKRGSLTSSDLHNQKTTYVTLLGNNGCRLEIEKLQRTARELLHSMNKNTSFLEQMMDKMLSIEIQAQKI